MGLWMIEDEGRERRKQDGGQRVKTRGRRWKLGDERGRMVDRGHIIQYGGWRNKDV